MTPTITHRRLALVLLPLFAISGCAVRYAPGKGPDIGIDRAALFGKAVETFTLPDGSEGSIREFERRFSVKFGIYSRVVEIDKAVSVRFRSAQEVDGYTLIVLDKAERNCRVKTHLLAIRGKEVKSWDFGNCTTPATASVDSAGATFDLSSGTRVTRYQFANGSLVYGEMVPASDQANRTAAAPAVSAKTKAPLPARVPARDAAEPSAASPALAVGTENAIPPKAPARSPNPPHQEEHPGPGKLVFKAKEQVAPRTAYLNQ